MHAEFDNTDGTLLISRVLFRRASRLFGQFVRALRAESSDSSSSLILGVHDWELPWADIQRRVSKNLEGDRALIPLKVVLNFRRASTNQPQRPFEGVPIYWGIFVHLVYRTAFATAFALSRVWHFLGVLFLQVCSDTYIWCIWQVSESTEELDQQRSMGPSVKNQTCRQLLLPILLHVQRGHIWRCSLERIQNAASLNVFLCCLSMARKRT